MSKRKPVWHILAGGEFSDAVWLAELLAHGLIRASFVPDTPTQELRTLLRTRKQLVRVQASHMRAIPMIRSSRQRLWR